MYQKKYIKYKSKYLELKKNDQIGGTKFKIVNYKPKYKMIRYEKKIAYITNNIDNEKINEFSEFLLGSITKVFTVIILLILQQNKLLNINDKVSKYIKNNKNNDFSKITIMNLMNHNSGMKRMPDKLIVKHYKTATDASDSFIEEKLFTLTKNSYSYSNIGYILLGRIIEFVTWESYIDIFKKYIFDPCQMNHTGIGDTNIILYDYKGTPLTKRKYNERFFASTAGALYSCLNDLVNFAKKLNKILDEDSLESLRKMYFFTVRDNIIYITHGGNIYGGSSMLSIKYTNEFKFMGIFVELKTLS